ncbi:MAG: cytochrome c3 family protein [Phycisphaerae bacterium]|nr:cytochrome c3 family protein [Phycisphaerae bacterium]
MSDMSSTLKRIAAAAAIVATLLLAIACNEQRWRDEAPGGGPARSDRAEVAALGNLRCGRMPTSTEAELSQFFFGAEPAGPMRLVKPVGLLVRDDRILVADMARRAVLQWERGSSALRGLSLAPTAGSPIALADDGAGGLLVTDGDGGRVLHFDGSGQFLRAFELGAGARPVDAVRVHGEIWITDAARHTVEIFDGSSGVRLRTLGKRGDGRGEFGMPLGIAADSRAFVYVVDMLNARVQVFDSSGTWKRQIGGPGARVGAFGRPKDVVVGPDGVIFVSDAATQRIHAFDADGGPLLAFGAPAETAEGLWLPNSLAISSAAVPAKRVAPAGFQANYYVLVTEQMSDAGVRVFAWRSPSLAAAPSAVQRVVRKPAATVASPHWSAAGCQVCHTSEPPSRIDPARVNDLCLSCHDGVKAAADAHPIAVPARSEHTRTPDDWPTHEGRIGCLTCHDIARHCDRSAGRPATNAGLLREYDASKPLQFCGNCHDESSAQRLNPHRDSGGETCRICHLNSDALPRDGVRRGTAGLNDPSSRGCLRCHVEHWDYAPTGHLGKPLAESHRERLRSHDALGSFPLGANGIACFTCHNPHASGTFPTGSALSSRATRAADAKLLLRADQPTLCSSCHIP